MSRTVPTAKPPPVNKITTKNITFNTSSSGILVYLMNTRVSDTCGKYIISRERHNLNDKLNDNKCFFSSVVAAHHKCAKTQLDVKLMRLDANF